MLLLCILKDRMILPSCAGNTITIYNNYTDKVYWCMSNELSSELGARRGTTFGELFFRSDTKNRPGPSDLDQTQNVQPRTRGPEHKVILWKYSGTMFYRVRPGYWLCPPPGPQTTCDPGTGGSAPRQQMMTCDEAPGDYQHCVVISPSAWEV